MSTVRNVKKEIAKCKHPNSRKTIALAKKTKKVKNKNEAKLGQLIKQNIVGEKCLWFKENVPETGNTIYNKSEILAIIEKYLARFDEELVQIEVKNSIGGKRNRQHASREDVIKMTRERETLEFNTCGLEIPDLGSSEQVVVLKTWNGELRFLQNFKFKRFSRKNLT